MRKNKRASDSQLCAREKEVADLLDRLKQLMFHPGISMYAVAAGGTFIYAEINWKTLLKKGSLKVLLTPNTQDVTSQFTINDAAMKATATFDCGAVGVQMLQASGEFLTFFLPPSHFVKLRCSAAVYIPS